MSKQVASRVLAIVFMLVGFVIIGVVLAQKPLALYPLVAGIIVAIFGALIFPSSGAGPAFQTVTVALGNLPFFGGRRASDGVASVVVATSTQPATKVETPIKQEGSS